MKNNDFDKNELKITINDPTWIDIPIEVIEISENVDFVVIE